MAQPISVSMFGEFSICRGDSQIDDSSNRMRKVWLLLAYLIFNRKSRISQEQLLSLTQGTEEVYDPAGRLKALFYRVRAMLEPLGEGIGHELIIFKNGRYSWNTETPLTLDVEDFEALYNKAATLDDSGKLPLLLEALNLYKGDFLAKLSMESWVMPISAYYHQKYLNAAQTAISLLYSEKQYPKALEVCKNAIKIEPYCEEFYQYLMRCLIAVGNSAEAISTYENMSTLLFDTYGVMPSDESRSIYREAYNFTDNKTFSVPSEAVQNQLKEAEGAKGAVFCEYDFFKLLYQVQARSVARSGDVIHIALFSVQGKDGQSLSRRSLDVAMENLQELTVNSLRQGDVVTRCSASQFIVMLPQANYENSRLVCRRIIKAFNRQYPHSPAELKFNVHPLEPTNGNLSGKRV